MTTGGWLFLAAAAAVAVGDWWAVHRRQKSVEYVCKPLTMALLIGVAVAVEADSGSVRAWFVVALALALLGDVFLMLPRDAFVPGLVAFLLAHVAFIVGFWIDGVELGAFAVGVGVAAVAVVVIGRRVMVAVRDGEHAPMAVPVAAYMAVISMMVASAVGTTEALAIGGAALFFCSDAMIAWERFVRPQGWHRLAIIVTYHLGQAGLTLSLIT